MKLSARPNIRYLILMVLMLGVDCRCVAIQGRLESAALHAVQCKRQRCGACECKKEAKKLFNWSYAAEIMIE